jgi:BlaI family penicillinase repressor
MKKISDAELEVLKIIWKKEKVNSLDIINELEEFNWNNNTVRTLIKRLLEKEAIEIIEKNGKSFTYVAKIEEDEFKFEKTKNLLNQLFDGDINKLLENYNKYLK